MTREEAIERLKHTDACDVDLCTALDMAIKSLEQDTCEDRLKNLEESIVLINDTIGSLTRTTALIIVDIEDIKKEVKNANRSR